MSGFRWQIEVSAAPAREALIDRRSQLLIRVRLFDPPDHAGRYDKPDAFSDLRSNDARQLAFELLAAAEHAELLTAQDIGSEDEP